MSDEHAHGLHARAIAQFYLLVAGTMTCATVAAALRARQRVDSSRHRAIGRLAAGATLLEVERYLYKTSFSDVAEFDRFRATLREEFARIAGNEVIESQMSAVNWARNHGRDEADMAKYFSLRVAEMFDHDLTLIVPVATAWAQGVRSQLEVGRALLVVPFVDDADVDSKVLGKMGLSESEVRGYLLDGAEPKRLRGADGPSAAGARRSGCALLALVVGAAFGLLAWIA